MAPRTTAGREDDPNRLLRQRAGIYRTSDQRFEVRQASLGWFLVDTANANEFGQELVRGPFGTLDAVRDALPEARRETLKPLPTPRRTATAGSTGRQGKKAPTKRQAKPSTKPDSWMDELPRQEAAAVRRLIAALERDGVASAEKLVRDSRNGRGRGLAATLVERRLEAIIAAVPEDQQTLARGVARRVVDVLAGDGGRNPDPLPGWQLVETGDEAAGAPRRLIPRVPR